MAGHRNCGSGSGGGPRALVAQCLPHPLSCGASSCRNLHRSARSGVHSCIDALSQTVNNFNETKKQARYYALKCADEACAVVRPRLYHFLFLNINIAKKLAYIIYRHIYRLG